MESFLRLILLSIGMFVGALLAGILPFRLGLAENRHNLTTQRWTVFGSGLLVGTVLIVILPEGMEAVYGGSDNHHHESDVVPTLLGIRWHSWIGPVLAWGFSFMFLVDQAAALPKLRGRRRQQRERAASTASETSEANDEMASASYPGAESRTSSATLGLLVHAAADGVAMGAASTTNSQHLELVIFAAVLLHKAPAAFGLSTVLLREGYTRLQVLHRLLAFAIAAPLGALLTYGVLVASFMAAGVYGDKQELATDQIVRLNRLTGLLLLFSAGTFLYVATAHALPDTLALLKGGAGHHQHHHSFSNTFNTDSNELIYSNEELNVNGTTRPTRNGGNHHAHQGQADEVISLHERVSAERRASRASSTDSDELQMTDIDQQDSIEETMPLTPSFTTAKQLSTMLNPHLESTQPAKHSSAWTRNNRSTRTTRVNTQTPDMWSLGIFLIGIFIPGIFSLGHHH